MSLDALPPLFLWVDGATVFAQQNHLFGWTYLLVHHDRELAREAGTVLPQTIAPPACPRRRPPGRRKRTDHKPRHGTSPGDHLLRRSHTVLLDHRRLDIRQPPHCSRSRLHQNSRPQLLLVQTLPTQPPPLPHRSRPARTRGRRNGPPADIYLIHETPTSRYGCRNTDPPWHLTPFGARHSLSRSIYQGGRDD